MTLGNKITNVAHRSLIVVLAGITVYSFIGAGVIMNRRFSQSKENVTRRKLQEFSRENSNNLTTDDKKS
ncbi:hypothetical protein RhiirA5_498190 [Rhizophagus irregularis]|uniref:Uncharacterized protein n=3 Tax=Rhizophagus irregularis TaxID=588596 RepID=A0A2I1EFY7_9GLOM|nr:hypothetical protein GLOIN_2v1517092 [Rhizophagus irregularis DAOM 181602=DAOM 197198]EXX55131.1 hypothetical protein RirG_228180 [Rhizophagus irregularis DAOM 197198w]PKC10797.1 hypothetical protein RhiirA5_498190 [Rhizophagus irregularis]PKC67969.1 hypothetical protein RhiirA1_534520 [Rhizophagus irregularis]PKK73329.1 hypothetical protein RhiirC2_741028 [Rhizophagus irregularis]PKY21027.1 hypothetical protein RhiirB3_524729 [Rhizophagus irregularis]|eukprot:XP_025187200.1 hypothetical protein GLOIN_2v1517092 [Rhizophagus irregularis DAOM 181602=DAOM 197198]